VGERKKMNRYILPILTGIVTFINTNSQSSSVAKSLVVALTIGGAVLLTLLFYDYIIRPIFGIKSPNAPDASKYSPLLLAAAEGNLQSSEELINSKESVDQLGPNGETALMLAARNGHHSTVKWLLEKGADTKITTPKGNTALSIAIKFKHNEIVDLLSNKT
jgi:ankyrin repeat protein